ncbi:coiled-coil domain-containing protein 167-like [Dreissena polymorpha]|uniref:Coiled-coil domain-containing protein 167 n=1 Tax=Dreissena polymorpha TaxID=45954 RepID=A0A9D4L837_DREPO|nr:coiled-coil domain-containing protein 167-like [Dreissena polymorpha]KAH3852994.1 hypothetical protein DPMN_095517 [Dreissena polymorpha]
MPTIVSQLETTEKDISSLESRLDTIERRLRISNLSDDQIKSLEKEEKDLQKKLKDKRQSLSGLRVENGKNMVISVVLLGLIVLVYYVFVTP